jgi:glycosyltransferase involved in cell wall biosynthesis
MTLFLIILIPLALFAIIAVYNYLTAPILKPGEVLEKPPLLSVLIPARNEEKNIKKCLDNLLNQDYENYKIFILDDESTDDTYSIIKNIEKNNQKLIVLKGKPLPGNWIGKNWACHQLSENAGGDLLLFIDADVELSSSAVSSAVVQFQKNNVDLLSVFPSQKIISLGEWLTVPLMNWLLLSFLPLKLVYTVKNQSLAAANGQFMLWNRKSYLQLNGHKAVSSEIVEDMEMAKLAKKMNKKVITFLGGEEIKCRMYNDFKEAINGFSKNFYPGFKINPFLFLLFLAGLFLLFIFPIILAAIDHLFLPLLILIIINRLFVSAASKQNIFINILLHPFQMILLFLIGINSMNSASAKKRSWKGRPV